MADDQLAAKATRVATPDEIERRNASISARRLALSAAQEARAESTKQKPQDEAVERAVLVQLGLAVRGLPARRSVLNMATGVAAELRDLINAHDGDQALRRLVVDWTGLVPERLALLSRVFVERDDNAEALARDAFARVPATPVLAADEPPAPNVLRTSSYAVNFVSVQRPGQQAEQRIALHTFTPAWRLSEAGYQKRVERKLQQVLAEQAAGGNAFVIERMPDDASWRRLSAKWRKRKQRAQDTADAQNVRYVALPQSDGSVVVLHDSERDAQDNARPLPTDDGELRTLLHGLLATPDGKRTDTSVAFGGSYVNQRGNGLLALARREGARVVVGRLTASGPGGIHTAARALETKVGKTMSAEVGMPWLECYERLAAIGHSLKPIDDKHAQTLAELLGTYDATKDVGQNVEQDDAQDVSRLSDINTRFSMSLRRDMPDAPPLLELLDIDDEAPPDRQPALLVVNKVAR